MEDVINMAPQLPPKGETVVAALPRSPLHVRLLVENAADVDLVLYRDAGLVNYLPPRLRERALFLGREVRWRPGGGLLSARRANARYYRHVAETVRSWNYRRLILFLESEPLESCIMDVVPLDRIELWEEGLGHYCNMHGPAFYAARATAQLVSGFYPHRIFNRRGPRERLHAVRDRFVSRDLRLPHTPAPDRAVHDAVLFIGAPLVKDGWMSWNRYLWAIERIVGAAPRPVFYYPHPREDLAQIKALERNFGDEWFRVLVNDADVAVHCAHHQYRHYLTAFSTALLELGSRDNSAYLAHLFGLKRVHRELAKVPFLPCRTIDRWADLGAFLAIEPAAEPSIMSAPPLPLRTQQEAL